MYPLADMKPLIAAMALVVFFSPNGFSEIENKITIFEQQLDGEKAIIMENAFYRATFVPARAMWPLWYYYKPTGHEVFLKREKTADAYGANDGLVVCLPWMGDTLRHLPDKGLLKTAPWETSIERKPGQAVAVGRKQIEYPDLTTGRTNRLAFNISVAGQAEHSQLKMEYQIENIGQETAKFIFVGHARVAIGGSYDEGDYVYVPGKKCWVGDFKWPVLEKQGVKPYQWTSWPIEGVVDFAFKPEAERKGKYIYAFVPSSWAVVGNNKSREFAFFCCSPITIGSRIQATPYYCIVHRDADYLLELSLTPELDARNWDKPGAVSSLEPGEKAAFTMYMTIGQNLAKDDILRIRKATQKFIKIRSKSGMSKTLLLAP